MIPEGIPVCKSGTHKVNNKITKKIFGEKLRLRDLRPSPVLSVVVQFYMGA